MKRRFIVLGLVFGGVCACLSQLPLKWVGSQFIPQNLGQNLQYSGTIWDGTVSNIDYVGTARFELSPKAVISGGLPLSFYTQSSAMQISGQVSQEHFKDIRFFGKLAQLPTRDGRLKELNGGVIMTVSDMQIGEGCLSAVGQASTDFLMQNEARWYWQGPQLSGPTSCEAGDFVVNLSGSENGQTIKADLRLSWDGSYRADISVATSQPEAGAVLPLYGFEQQGRDYKLTEQGQWR